MTHASASRSSFRAHPPAARQRSRLGALFEQWRPVRVLTSASPAQRMQRVIDKLQVLVLRRPNSLKIIEHVLNDLLSEKRRDDDE